MLAAVPSATIMRPSLVFGPEDQLTNRFAALARMLPVLPLIGGGTNRVQPVFVGDVATAVADAAEGKARSGAVYELGGPEVMTMRQIQEFVLATIERSRMLVPLPFALARLQSLFLQFAPQPLQLTPDQIELLRTDNVVSDSAKARGPHAGRPRHCARHAWRRRRRRGCGASARPASSTSRRCEASFVVPAKAGTHTPQSH